MTPYARRGRRRLVRLIVALLVLLGLLLAADRIADYVAERTAASMLQKSQGLQHRPDVDITGFPFLTQLAAGHFDEIDVTARDFPVGRAERSVLVHQLDVHLHDVTVSRNFHSATSRFSTATALIRYQDLSTALGVEVSYAGAERLRVAHRISVAGVGVDATATTGLQVAAEALRFTAPQVSVAGQQVPAAVSRYFADLFGPAISLAGMPFGVHVDAVGAAADGLHVTLSARQLTFSR